MPTNDRTPPRMPTDPREEIDRSPGSTRNETTELTRHEERLAARARPVAYERIRVERRAVGDEVAVPVQLRRQLLVVESVDGRPIPGLDAALAGQPLVLHEERATAGTRAVAYEKVRIEREVSTVEHVVTDTVRLEQVEIDRLDGC